MKSLPQNMVKQVNHYPSWKNNNYYYKNIQKFIQSLVIKDSRVLEIGAGTKKLTSNLNLKGISILELMKKQTRLSKRKSVTTKSSQLTKKELQIISKNKKFDFVIGTDLIEYLNDLVVFFEQINKITHNNSKVIFLSINSAWKPIIYIARKLGLTSLEIIDEWISLNELQNIAEITNFRIIDKGYCIIFPKYIPFLSDIINGLFLKIPLLKRFGLIQYIVLSPNPSLKKENLSCSIVVPCFNEEDNIEDCIKNCPKLGKFTELIIVDDGSTDSTVQKARLMAKRYPFVRVISYKPNRGKAYAVEKGFNAAKGDIIMIWDADRTVPENELYRFYEVLATKQAEFANGTRLLYPMEDQAMKWLNLVGNKIFSLIFGWILNTNISDTLCGTKALFKKDYKKIKMGNEPWGDFDLLFGAAKLNLKIREVPVHYRKRIAGESKMKVFKHGLMLGKMAIIGIIRLKFNYEK